VSALLNALWDGADVVKRLTYDGKSPYAARNVSRPTATVAPGRRPVLRAASDRRVTS
jgi:hypothetical protein